MSEVPRRGEIWLTDLDPTVGHEQAGRRPCLVISDDIQNSGPTRIVVVLPLTTRDRGLPLRIRIDPPEGNLRTTSFAIPEMIRGISTLRLIARWGSVTDEVMRRIEENTKALLRFR